MSKTMPHPKVTAMSASLESRFKMLDFDLSVGLSNAFSVFRDFIPNLVSEVGISFGSLLHLNEYRADTPERRFLINNFSKISYEAIHARATMVPEGFNGNLLDYLNDLFSIVESYQGFNNSVLQPLYGDVAAFLSNEAPRVSTVEKKPFYEGLKQQREAAAKKIGEKFLDSGTTAKRKVGDVCGNSGQITDCIIAVESARNSLEKINLKQIESRVKELYALLDKMSHRIKSGEINRLSPEVAENLSTGIYEVAKQIEFLASIHYAVMVAETCVDKLVETINAYIRE